VEADVYVWRYTLLVEHARKEEAHSPSWREAAAIALS